MFFSYIDLKGTPLFLNIFIISIKSFKLLPNLSNLNCLKNLEYNLLYSLNNKQQLTEYGMIQFSNLQKEKQIKQIVGKMDKNFEHNNTINWKAI